MRKAGDEVFMILDAIDAVRGQLKNAAERGENFIVLGEILLRLTTLYSLVNTDQIRALVERRDLTKRPFQSSTRKKAA